jgi:hypothetical protein
MEIAVENAEHDQRDDRLITYAGSQGTSGLDQAKVLLHRSLAASGTVPVAFSVSGKRPTLFKSLFKRISSRRSSGFHTERETAQQQAMFDHVLGKTDRPHRKDVND